jgi:hypothetical protein
MNVIMLMMIVSSAINMNLFVLMTNISICATDSLINLKFSFVSGQIVSLPICPIILLNCLRIPFLQIDVTKIDEINCLFSHTLNGIQRHVLVYKPDIQSIKIIHPTFISIRERAVSCLYPGNFKY